MKRLRRDWYRSAPAHGACRRAECEPACSTGAAIAMKKYRLTLQQLAATFWLSAALASPATVRAADQPPPAAAVSEPSAPTAQDSKPVRLQPEQFSQLYK